MTGPTDNGKRAAGAYTPTRRCEGCGERKPKPELIRLVRGGDGILTVNRDGRAQTRGAYVCPSEKCISRALKAGRITRRLSAQITEEFKASVLSELTCDG